MRLVWLIAIVVSVLFCGTAMADYAVGLKAYSAGNYEVARTQFAPDAEAGDSRAQLALALIFHKGLGVERDFAKAIGWYEKSSNQGNATAQNNLGVMYRRGEGVEQDPREAFAWIWAAAMQGFSRAELNLADMYRAGEGVAADPILAYAWLRFAISGLPATARQVAEDRRKELVAEMSEQDLVRAERMAEIVGETRKRR